ncbi:MAG: amidohydrolase family protein [Paracoccaceae bacterium]
MQFIDTHQHLIYRDKFGYGWTGDISALKSGDFTLAEYHKVTEGLGISGSIFMETGVDDADYQAEARFLAGLIGQPENRILGQIASCRPEQDVGFDAWLAEGDGLQVCGYRRILHVVPDDLSKSTGFRRNIAKIGAKGLAFDMCFLARQLPIAHELAKACDDQTLVLDHCGVPDIAAGAFGAWAAEISALAALPHVICKLSGVSAYCAPRPATEALLRPWVDHIMQTFGPERILWGSDWPVVNLGIGLPDWVKLCRTFLARLSPNEARAVAFENARRVYRLG